MFNVGDYARHQSTGQLGQIVGYGHEIVDGVYLPTLKVQVVEAPGGEKSFVEDLASVWQQQEQRNISEMGSHRK